jgi:hypothetical protein
VGFVVRSSRRVVRRSYLEGDTGHLHLTQLFTRTHLLALRRALSNGDRFARYWVLDADHSHSTRRACALAPFGVVIFVAFEWQRSGSDIAVKGWGGGRREGNR